MTGFRQRQAPSTLTVPTARGLAPHFLVQPKHLKCNPPATEITIELYGFPSSMGGSQKYSELLLIKTKTVMVHVLKHIEHHHNHSESNILTTQ